MGLPNRFIHWYWGGTYKELVTQQNKEVFSILELVLNTVPSHAFLRSSNTYLQNVLVIARVLATPTSSRTTTGTGSPTRTC